MSPERSSPATLSYAAPAKKPKRGELGALPALICLIVGLFGILLVLIAVLAMLSAGVEQDFNVIGLLICSPLVGAGVFFIWLAMRVDRRYRSILPD